MKKQIILLAIFLCAMSFFTACGDDAEEEKKEDKTEKEEEKTESEDSVPEWPSVEAMESTTYYPIGTKWQEVWAARKLKSMSEAKSSRHKMHMYDVCSEYYEEEPYAYFTVTFEVTEDSVVEGKTLHHIVTTNDFVKPDISYTIGVEGIIKNIYIYEDKGAIYQYNISYNPGLSHPAEAYDFVWTEGKELSRIKYTTFDEYMYDPAYDEYESLGIVEKDSIENVKLLDGNYYLYLPASHFYRGIGTTVGSIFLDVDNLLPDCLYDIVKTPVGLLRFWHGDTLVYQDDEMAKLVE